MLDNLVTPVVAVAIILAITLPIWFLVLLVRLVRNVGRIAEALERGVFHVHDVADCLIEPHPRAVANSIFGR